MKSIPKINFLLTSFIGLVVCFSQATLTHADEAALEVRILQLESRLQVLENKLQTQTQAGNSCRYSKPNADSPYLASKNEVDILSANQPTLLTQIRAVPYFKDGKSIGLRIFSIRPGSFFDCIGLKNGDIIIKALDRIPGDAVEMVSLISKEAFLNQQMSTISIIRDRSPYALHLRRK